MRGSLMLASFLVACMVLQVFLAFVPGTGRAVAGDRDVRNWSIMGLDIRDYASQFKAKVPAAERRLVRHHKLVVRWESVNPRRGTWNFSYYDGEINSVLADGSSSLLLLLQGPVPSWARDPDYGEFADKAPPRDLSWWREFCSRVAERYGKVVDFYEIWNEVGFDRDGEAMRNYNVYHFGGQAETDYLPLLQLAYEAIKEKDPTALVICGDMITTNNPDPKAGTGLFALLFDEVGRPGQDISLKVESTGGIVAERPMYFNYMGSWDGGHDVVGALQPTTQWYFAEGCTRRSFDMWLCLQNPHSRQIQVTTTYMFGPGQGANVEKTYTLSPTSRFTVKVDDEVGEEKDVSVKLTSTDSFIAERPMYFHYNWKWTGGHCVMGALQPAGTWYFAEGCHGYNIEQYLCLQNPQSSAVEATLTFMMKKGEVLRRKVTLPARSRTTIYVNRYIGFVGSCDMVAVHPYKMPNNWGPYYANVVNVLRSRGVPHEAVVTEVGWPHYSDKQPTAFSEQQQADALLEWGMRGLINHGARKIWIYKGMDEAPGTSWDYCYYGLFDYYGRPLKAWNSYKYWQLQSGIFPDYPRLPGSL